MCCSYEIILLQAQLSIMDMILTLVLNSVQLVDLSIFLYLCEVCWIVNAAKFGGPS